MLLDRLGLCLTLTDVCPSRAFIVLKCVRCTRKYTMPRADRTLTLFFPRAGYPQPIQATQVRLPPCQPGAETHSKRGPRRGHRRPCAPLTRDARSGCRSGPRPPAGTRQRAPGRLNCSHCLNSCCSGPCPTRHGSPCPRPRLPGSTSQAWPWHATYYGGATVRNTRGECRTGSLGLTGT